MEKPNLKTKLRSFFLSKSTCTLHTHTHPPPAEEPIFLSSRRYDPKTLHRSLSLPFPLHSRHPTFPNAYGFTSDSDSSNSLFSSDSSEYYSKTKIRRRRCRKRRRRGGARPRVRDVEGFAVEKETWDPYGDFRVSMLEMILEKQIFGQAELEKLLRCYLELNSVSNHSLILQVFEDICMVLFGRS